MAAILLVEDDLTFSRILEGFLSKHGFQVTVCNKGKEALKVFQGRSFDLLLVDYRLPDLTGMDILFEIKKTSSTVPVVIMTSFHDIRTAVKAIKSGAFEYITKPVNPDELLMVVKQALKKEQGESSEKTVSSTHTYVQGSSTVAAQVKEFIELVAPTNMSVLIEG